MTVYGRAGLLRLGSRDYLRLSRDAYLCPAFFRMATIPGLHNYHQPDSEISDSEGEGSPSSISAPGVGL